ncbi:hypothetical protein APUTEX25_002637 [Auxenochlorella protothecoides]|uniref:BZIP domain-containing protein n=1 Tax=Auxenochlorella protothecoides TaxID=3075 RepID=A0A3M7KWB2_AUXPR|nr:hypothetical protein APUTEX25_002637 [Auxenochlorella protothecoides]|eukprot:RMZ54060.1 hypothetical protein APUTEX25_002637 [Auxenochlorella protothecoides]
MSTLVQPLFEPEDVWPGVLMDDDVLESFQASRLHLVVLEDVRASPSASAVQFPLTHQALDDLDQFEINRPPSPGQVLELLSDGVGTSPWGLDAGAVADPGKPDEAFGELIPMARPIHTPTRSADGSAHHQTSSGEDASNTSRYQQSSPASQQDGAAGADEDEAKRAIRMARNRENAHLSRQRKKAQLEGLEQTCSALTGQVRALSTFVGQLTAENELLRRHLAAACTAAGRPLPDLPRAPGPQLVLLPPPAPGAAPVVALSLAQPLSEPVFKAWGMPPPGICRKLHSIEAGSLPLPLDVSRGDLVEFLEGRLGAQGRALSAVAPPLPRPLALLPGEGPEAPRDYPGAAESVGADPSQCPPSPTRDVEEESENVVRHDWMSVAEPVLLTALSAPAANASNGAGAAAAPGVVVVMLEPGRRLVTYACDDAVPRVAARAA